MDGPRYAFDLAGRLTGACDDESQIILDINGNPQGIWSSCINEYGQDEWYDGAPTYGYDAAGNRVEPSASPVVGSGNRVTRFKGYEINYDANGNVWRKAGLGDTGPSDTTLLTWDARNRLVRVEAWPAGGAHMVVTFGYDARGRRVKKSVNGVTQWFVYDGDHVVLDVDAATRVVQVEYGYRPGVDDLFAVKTPSWTGIAITDAQVGTVRGIANAQTGATIKQYSYTAWGETQADTGGKVRLRLAGREYDQETRLYYNRARYYDPKLGRFLSEDPIGIEGGLNLYTYAGNDPVNGRDPSGLMMVCVVTEWLVYTTYQGVVVGSYTDFTMSCTGDGGSGMWTPPAGYPSTFGTFPGGGGGGGGSRQPSGERNLLERLVCPVLGGIPLTYSFGWALDLVPGWGAVLGSGVFIGGSGIGAYKKEGLAFGYDVSFGFERAWTIGTYGGKATDVAVGNTTRSFGVSENEGSGTMSTQVGSTLPPGSVRVGRTTTTPTAFLADCRS